MDFWLSANALDKYEGSSWCFVKVMDHVLTLHVMPIWAIRLMIVVISDLYLSIGYTIGSHSRCFCNYVQFYVTIYAEFICNIEMRCGCQKKIFRNITTFLGSFKNQVKLLENFHMAVFLASNSWFRMGFLRVICSSGLSALLILLIPRGLIRNRLAKIITFFLISKSSHHSSDWAENPEAFGVK